MFKKLRGEIRERLRLRKMRKLARKREDHLRALSAAPWFHIRWPGMPQCGTLTICNDHPEAFKMAIACEGQGAEVFAIVNPSEVATLPPDQTPIKLAQNVVALKR